MEGAALYLTSPHVPSSCSTKEQNSYSPGAEWGSGDSSSQMQVEILLMHTDIWAHELLPLMSLLHDRSWFSNPLLMEFSKTYEGETSRQVLLCYTFSYLVNQTWMKPSVPELTARLFLFILFERMCVTRLLHLALILWPTAVWLRFLIPTTHLPLASTLLLDTFYNKWFLIHK